MADRLVRVLSMAGRGADGGGRCWRRRRYNCIRHLTGSTTATSSSGSSEQQLAMLISCHDEEEGREVEHAVKAEEHAATIAMLCPAAMSMTNFLPPDDLCMQFKPLELEEKQVGADGTWSPLTSTSSCSWRSTTTRHGRRTQGPTGPCSCISVRTTSSGSSLACSAAPAFPRP
eukprot:219166-Hanusia_phi.AAC.1